MSGNRTRPTRKWTVHMYLATDTNTTSDQWSCLHKNILFLVIILTLKHVLFGLMQKYLSLVINCLLCCMNWYSWGVIRKSHCIGTCLHRIHSYGCKILPYVAATIRMRSDAVLSSTGALLMKTVIKNNCQLQMVHFRFGRIRWIM